MDLAIGQKHAHTKASALIQHTSRWPVLDFISTANEDISNGVEWTINDHRHAIIVHRGGVMSELETELDGKGKSFGPANAGEIWIAPAGSNYAARSKGTTVDHSVIFIDPETIKTCLPEGADFSTIAPLHAVRDDFCYQLAMRLMDCANGDNDLSQMMGESISHTVGQHLYQKYGLEYLEKKKTDEPMLGTQISKQLQEYIYDNMPEPMKLEALSDIAGMTTHHFLIAFRQAFGTTPAQYIIEQRLRRVQWLLANSKHDITTIAYDTGFSSHSHLTTTFKKRFGCSPTEFRRTWKH